MRLSIATGIPYSELVALDDAILNAYLEEFGKGRDHG